MHEERAMTKLIQQDCSQDWSDDEEDDGQGDTPAAQDHLRVFHDLEQIEKMAGGKERVPDEIADQVAAPVIRNQRYVAMFENCQRMLGTEFNGVYQLLKRARGASNVDEAVLIKQLFSMVSLPQQQKTNALFLLEQIVFQELQYHG